MVSDEWRLMLERCRFSQLLPSYTNVDTTFGRATVTTRWILSNALTPGATYIPRLRVRGMTNATSTTPAFDMVVDGVSILVQAQYVLRAPCCQAAPHCSLSFKLPSVTNSLVTV
jgi:hypothetical protein